MALPPLHPTGRSRRAAGLAAAALAATLLAGCTTGSVGTGQSSGSRPVPAPTVAGPTGSGRPGADGPVTGRVTGAATPPAAGGASSPAPGIGSGDAAPPSGSGAPRTVPVQITIHDWNAKQGQAEVDAFVPGAVIPGGTCTLTMTQGSVRRSATRAAVTTPASTSCGLITIARSRLAAGSWQAVVRFRAPTASGASDPVPIQVPA